MRSWTVLAAVALLVPGCAVEDNSPLTPPAGQDLLSFNPAVALPFVCPGSATAPDCFEPTIAADSQGRLFVSEYGHPDIAVSADAGQTWAMKPGPLALDSQRGGADALLQVAPSGRLYYSAMTFRVDTAPFTPADGIKVAWSDDGGETWEQSQVGILYDASHRVGPRRDRPWLGFGADQTVYLSFADTDATWVARSDDGGATWNQWTRGIPVEMRPSGGQGAIAVSRDGTVFLGACDAPALGVAGGNRAMVFVSHDRGASFDAIEVDATGCVGHPMAITSPDGFVYLTYQGLSDALRVAWSTDDGGSWNAADWGTGIGMTPWPVVHETGMLSVAWFKANNGVELHVTRGTHEGVLQDAIAASGIDSTYTLGDQGTDFASLAILPDGRVAVVHAGVPDTDQKIWVVVES